MSEIKKLIERLCPDGVEYKKLGEVCVMQRGTSMTKKNAIEGDIPVISGGREPAFYINQSNRDGETITVAGSGAGAGYVQYWNEPIFVNDAFSVKGSEELLTKYVYYCMKNMQEQITGTQKGGGVPHVHISSIDNFELPVPPIEVQSKIVEILDNFTELEAELKIKLEAELEARRKQYEYYRNQLLTFDKVGGARFVNMSEIGKFYGGLSGKNKNDFGIGKAKYITYMNVYSNIAVDLSIAEDVNVTDDEKQNSIQYGDIIFTGSSETPEECGMSSVVTENMEEPIYLNSFCFGFRIDDLSVFNVHFLKHLFRSHSLRSQIVKTASGVTRFNVSKKKMENVEVPIPPLSEQKRIASILDRFEALTTDLQSGLPAEIEARRKQYEYYREKLLTFKRKTA